MSPKNNYSPQCLGVKVKQAQNNWSWNACTGSTLFANRRLTIPCKKTQEMMNTYIWNICISLIIGEHLGLPKLVMKKNCVNFWNDYRRPVSKNSPPLMTTQMHYLPALSSLAFQQHVWTCLMVIPQPPCCTRLHSMVCSHRVEYALRISQCGSCTSFMVQQAIRNASKFCWISARCRLWEMAMVKHVWGVKWCKWNGLLDFL